MTKIYYGPEGNNGEDYRLVPAPIINISTEFSYSNDTIIGYIYKINLEGYCSNFRRSATTDDSNTNPDYYAKNIQKVVGGMELVRKILSRNGGNFAVYKEDDDSLLFKAKGGTLRSLNFDETDNAWSVYSKYSAEIEFNEIEFLGESISCNIADFNAASKSPNVVDLDKYKIKTFTDGWTFSITDQSFDYVRNIDTNSNLAIHNMVINASYNINVTGKNYYVEDKLIPAHEQARIFAQKRLYERVSQLVVGGNNSNILKVTTSVNHDPCGSDTLNSIHADGSGILGNITYLPHNETVDCQISESNGSFSANYNCILKSKAMGMNYSSPNVIHKVNKSRTRNREANKNNYTISVDGSIEGLVLGGLIYSAGNFSLPNSGSFILKANDNITKFSSASTFYSSIATEYDLKDSLKQTLGISYSELNINIDNNNCLSNSLPSTPRPSSFNLTKNYIDGTINYTAEYSTNSACNRDGETVQKVSITTDNPVPVVAQFTIPNGEPPRIIPILNEQTVGTIIQDLKTFTAKKINITIEGKKPRTCCNTLEGILNGLECQEIALPTGVSLPDPLKFILTQKQRTDNKMEGTYTINLSYICDPGCSLL